MIEPARFSSRLEPAGQLEPALVEAAAELSHRFGPRPLLEWTTPGHVAFPVDIDVSLPARGPVAPIQKREPVLLVLHRAEYPLRAPQVYSDRSDFPRLPHLNPTRPGAPANFCLHRGDFDAWFAEHTLVDVVERVRGWLSDAAGGNLQRADDLWEPTVTIRNGGIVVFDHAVVASAATRGQERDPDRPGHGLMSILVADLSRGAPLYRAHLISPAIGPSELPPPPAADPKPEIYPTAGLLLWPRRGRATERYFEILPRTYGELVDLTSSAGTELASAATQHAALEFYPAVLIVLAVMRPKRVINTCEWRS